MEIESIVGNYAFPIAITIYLLWERRIILDSLRTSIDKNTESTNALIAAVEKK